MVHAAGNQQQAEVHLPEGKLALAKVTLADDELVLDIAASLPQVQPARRRPGSYTVELFRDEAQITATELIYGKNRYRLSNIDTLQIIKLHRRRSVIQKKLSNFLAGILITIGCVLCLGSPDLLIRLLGLALTVGSAIHAVYFNWWVEQRRRGEFGLLLTTKFKAKVVITSHSLKAVQALYQIVFSRLDRVDTVSKALMVNMYTGEITE